MLLACFFNLMTIAYSFYIILLTLCVAAYLFGKKRLPPYFAYLGWLLIIVLLVEIIKQQFKNHGLQYVSNAIEHFYQPLDFLLMSMTYYYALVTPLYKKIIRIVYPAYLVAAIAGSAAETISQRNTFSFALESLLLIVYACWFIREQFKNITEDKLSHNPFFWINTGTLVYYSCTFLQMTLYNYLDQSPDPAINVWAERLEFINRSANFLMYICYLIGLLAITKKGIRGLFK
jgi:hypothetical protein